LNAFQRAFAHKLMTFQPFIRNVERPFLRRLFAAIAECKAQELVPKWLGVTHIPLKPLSYFLCRDDGDLTVNTYNCSHHAASLFSEIACA
jgi:hypothetical protein